jgi:hypothetical protein
MEKTLIYSMMEEGGKYSDKNLIKYNLSKRKETGKNRKKKEKR